MFSKALAVVIAIAASVHAHAGVSPALGVQGQLTRNAVQRPSNQKPCGNANLGAIAQSTPVQAAADGTFSATAINFNGGRDGSRQFTATVDASGAGNAFNGQVQITTNGDAAPQGTGTQPIVAKLPAGTKCSGGASSNLCLVSFKSAGGFGNCVVVAQGGGAGGAAAGGAAAGGAAAGGAANGNKGAANNGAAGGAAGNNGAAAGNNNAKGGRRGGRRQRKQGQQQAQNGQAAPAPAAAQGGSRAPRFARYYLDEAEQ